ncbi:MAG: Fur family transcriptional regulator [Gammaproteobacteria bacterium]
MARQSFTRHTKQRAWIVDLLTDAGHFLSAAALHRLLVDRGRNVGLATVYRTLARLEEQQEVESVSGPQGERLFRICLDADHHHHVVCRGCGATESLANSQIERALDKEVRRSGYRDFRHELVVFGTCPRCYKPLRKK